MSNRWGINYMNRSGYKKSTDGYYPYGTYHIIRLAGLRRKKSNNARARLSHSLLTLGGLPGELLKRNQIIGRPSHIDKEGTPYLKYHYSEIAMKELVADIKEFYRDK